MSIPADYTIKVSQYDPYKNILGRAKLLPFNVFRAIHNKKILAHNNIQRTE